MEKNSEVDILVKDNYFEDADYMRELALSNSTYRVNNDLYGPQGGWKGKRTISFRLENTVCSCCNQLIQYDSEINKFISKQSKDILDLCDNHYRLSKKYPNQKFSITSYFHITTEETKNSMHNFLQDKFHTDSRCFIAGVVYLTPDAPITAGTSILDASKNQFVNVENKYNRLVAYDSSIIHGVSEVFGNSDDTGRLTFTFFIHDILDASYYD